MGMCPAAKLQKHPSDTQDPRTIKPVVRSALIGAVASHDVQPPSNFLREVATCSVDDDEDILITDFALLLFLFDC